MCLIVLASQSMSTVILLSHQHTDQTILLLNLTSQPFILLFIAQTGAGSALIVERKGLSWRVIEMFEIFGCMWSSEEKTRVCVIP